MVGGTVCVCLKTVPHGRQKLKALLELIRILVLADGDENSETDAVTR